MDNKNILIDTSIIIEHFRKKNKNNTSLYKLPETYNQYISVITAFEFKIGITNKLSLEYWDTMLNYFQVLDVKMSTIDIAADLFRKLRLENNLIEFRDLIIAASAIEHDIPLLTLNTKHFERINNLVLFNPKY